MTRRITEDGQLVFNDITEHGMIVARQLTEVGGIVYPPIGAAYEFLRLGYQIELWDSATEDLVAILKEASQIAATDKANKVPSLSFSVPAGSAGDISRANEIWLREVATGNLVNRFLLAARRDIHNA